MAPQAEIQQLVDDLKAQGDFLAGQVKVYESSKKGRKKLQKTVDLIKRTAEYLAKLPAERVTGDEAKADEAKADESKAEATEPEKVTAPEDKDDIDGWLAFLLHEPKNIDAEENVDRLRQKLAADGDWDKVVDVDIVRTELTDSGADKAVILVEVARIFEEEIGDLAKAFHTILAAHSHDLQSTKVNDELERLAEATEQWADVVAHLNEVAPTVEDDELAARLWVKLGQIYNDRLERPTYAEAALRHALEKKPDDGEAWDTLIASLKAGERWHQMIAALRKRLDTLEGADRVGPLVQAAAVYQDHNDPNEARILLEEALQHDPDHADALALYEVSLRALELYEPLVEVLQKKASKTEDPDRRGQILSEAAELLRAELEDPKAAGMILENLIEHEPENREMLQALYEIYEETEQVEDFLRVAEARLKLEDDEDDQLTILRRMTLEIGVEAKYRQQGIEALERILKLDTRDEESYQQLEELYTLEESWDGLINTLERHAEAAETPALKGDVLRAMAAVWDEKLGDSGRAADALERALEIDDEDRRALIYLSRLYEDSEDWPRLIEVLSRRSELEEREAERVELHRRIGEIAAQKLGDAKAAEERLTKALELDPNNFGALTALAELFKASSEWRRATKVIEDAERVTSNRLEKVRLLFEQGEIFRVQLEDIDKAVSAYAKVLMVDPEHVPSATILATHHYDNEEWDDAAALLDMLLYKIDAKEKKTLLDLHTKRGLAAKALGETDKAIEHLDAARALDPASRDVLRTLADLKFDVKAWTDSTNLYQALLLGHKQSLEPDELVHIYHRMGQVKMEAHEKDKALNLFQKALAIDPGHKGSADAVIYLKEEAKEYESVVETKRNLMEKITDPELKRQLKLDIADIYKDKLERPAKALEIYEELLADDPDHRVTLHQVLEIHSEAGEWDEAVAIVTKLGDLEPSPRNRAKFRFTAGLIHRDEREDRDSALAAFEAALDDAPHDGDILKEVVTILTQKEDWKELARAFRRHFKRLPENAPAAERIQILDTLGEIYLDKLGDIETAITAFESADALDPSANPKRRKRLAGLYLKAGPDKLDKAIEQNHKLLREDPSRIAVYKELTQLYIKTKNKDRTWCFCAALDFLKEASEDEALFFDRYRNESVRRVEGQLSGEQWRKQLRHPSENARLSVIFSAVAEKVALMTAQPHKKFNLKRSERIDVEKREGTLFELFVYGSRMLSINPRPELFIRADQPRGIQVANATERGTLLPTWLVDQQKLESGGELAMMFQIARQLTHMRPARYLWQALVSQTELQNVLLATLRLIAPSAKLPEASPEQNKIGAYLKRAVPPVVFEQLAPTAKELMADGPSGLDMAGWMQGTQRTAVRAGLLLTGDLRTVGQILRAEPDATTGITVKDRINDLVLFSVSPAYFDLRKQLGFALEDPK